VAGCSTPCGVTEVATARFKRLTLEAAGCSTPCGNAEVGTLPTAYCLLPTAYCLLPTAYCLLPAAYCLLPTAYCLLGVWRQRVTEGSKKCARAMVMAASPEALIHPDHPSCRARIAASRMKWLSFHLTYVERLTIYVKGGCRKSSRARGRGGVGHCRVVGHTEEWGVEGRHSSPGAVGFSS
jgi:hypothetical protein